MTAGVYAITNAASGKSYFGSSVNIESRLHSHFRLLNKGRHHSVKLQNAWNKHAPHNFTTRVVLICEPLRSHLIMYEQIVLDCFDSVRVGYNVCRRADSRLGVPHSPEARAKITAAQTGRPSPVKGIKFSDEHRAKISKALAGKPKGPLSAEHKAKLHNPEVWAKISKSLTGKKYGPHTDKWKAANSERMLGNQFRVGTKLSPEHAAALKAGARAYWAKRKGEQ